MENMLRNLQWKLILLRNHVWHHNSLELVNADQAPLFEPLCAAEPTISLFAAPNLIPGNSKSFPSQFRLKTPYKCAPEAPATK